MLASEPLFDNQSTCTTRCGASCGAITVSLKVTVDDSALVQWQTLLRREGRFYAQRAVFLFLMKRDKRWAGTVYANGASMDWWW